MGIFRTTWHASASAVITAGFFLLPYSGVLWPDFDTEFMPMGGHDAGTVSMASINVDDLLAEESREGETTDELSNREETESTDDSDTQLIDTQVVAVADPDGASTQAGASEQRKAATVSATRAEQAERKRARQTVADSERKKGRSCKKSDVDYDITRHSTTSYSVDEKIVKHYTGSIDAASELGLVSWHTDEDGERDGFIIRRLPCNSPLRDAGFRRGDVVHSINGKQIRTYAQGIAAWRILRNRKSVEVLLTKKSGKLRRVTYTVS